MFTFVHYQFTEVILKCLSCLVSEESTCSAFNNNKLFKKFKEKLAVTPGAITFTPASISIGSCENGNCYPPYQDAVYTSPHGGHQKFQWEGGSRGGNFQGDGVSFSRSFFSSFNSYS